MQQISLLVVMENYKTILKSKYPIVAMAMNKVSDISLAIAVAKAGGVPSFSIFNYKEHNMLEEDILKFKNTCNNDKFFISLGVEEFISQKIIDIIFKYNIDLIELISDGKEEHPDMDIREERKNNTLKFLKDNNIKVFLKCVHPSQIENNKDITGIILKGRNGAGRGYIQTETLFNHIKQRYPELSVIVSGGIGTADQVKYFIDKGALAVGIGTILAASKESLISLESKKKLVNASSSDLIRFPDKAQQSALLFKEVVDDNYNHTLGLKAGIVNPDEGHIFAGQSVDNITDIETVQTIINRLMNEQK